MAIRPYGESDRPWAESLLDEFGGPLQARHGELIDVLALPGFTAERDGQPVGLLTYRRANGECELAFIAALERQQGIGSALLEALRQEVGHDERIWLVTRTTISGRFASISAAASASPRSVPEPSTKRASDSSPRSRPSVTSVFRSETRSSSNSDLSKQAQAESSALPKGLRHASIISPCALPSSVGRTGIEPPCK